jgi:CheY-like chemotaxis protein
MKTILIIEDNYDILENTGELLEMHGYNVLTAAEGLTGITLAKKNKPDAIICDIMMPKMNGYQVFEALTQDSETEHIPFIFLTASAEKKEVEIGIKMGAKGYIRKPFEPDDLFETIEMCLSRTLV